jgi:hypothetical protein
MKHFAILLFALAPYLSAQTPVQQANPCILHPCFFATQSGTVNGSSSTALTIQQPATGFKQVNFIGAVAQCPGQTFTVDQSQNGTAASTTSGSAVPLIPYPATSAKPDGTAVPVATATVWTNSNVGAGTAVAPTLTYTSGNIATTDISQRSMSVAGTAVN